MIKVHDRVILRRGGKEYLGTVVNINEFREPALECAVDLDSYTRDVVFAEKTN